MAQARTVTRLLRDKRVGVLHTHVYHADTIGYLATRRVGIPWVTTLHGFTGGDLKNRAYTKLDLLLIRRCEAVICVAENVRERAVAEGLDPRRLHLVPNGYLPAPPLPRDEARVALGLDEARPVVGWVGRLSHEKGADLWLDALALLAHEDLMAVVVGDGAERSSLEAKARALGLGADRVRFVGQVDDAASLLPAFDALALSSRTEGTPMVVLEAMAAGVPIVSFAVGGIPQVLDDSSAFLVSPGDIGGLARAMMVPIIDPEEARRRTRAADRLFRARYSVGPAVTHHSKLYDEVADRADLEGRR
jgi:glycosyltransferase involved in cell wall biosynthesis